jgi:DNA-binding SARP family transcriptional activator
VDFRLLGSLEVWDAGREVGIPGAKRRALLAILLLHRNEVVARDSLVDMLWGERPPPSAAHSLEVQVSKLRGLLGGDGSRLQTRPPGYVMRVEPGELDVERFKRLAADGHRALAAGDAQRAARVLREALAVARGPALAEFAFEPFAQGPIARLAELQAVVLEDRVDADLALGEHAELVGELEALVAAEPLRERRRLQLMLALYRCGRQGDALAAYRAARRVLVEELGLEPTRELRELEGAILRQDETLDLARLATAPPASTQAQEGARGRWLAAAVGAGAVVVALAAALLIDGGGGRGARVGSPPLPPDSVGLA